jgi:hypothetical protein
MLAFTGDKLCEFPTDKNWDSIRDSFEQCPWPSRQVPVGPQVDMPKVIKTTIAELIEIAKAERAAGRASALREAVEAVKSQNIFGMAGYPDFIVKEDTLAALRSLEEK